MEYADSGLRVWAGFGLIRVSVYPMSPRLKRLGQKSKKKEAKESEKEPEDEAPKTGVSLELFQDFLSLGIETARRFRARLRIEELTLYLNWGMDDPADAAFTYGIAGGVLESFVTLMEVNFKVKKKSAQIHLDYTLDRPNIYCKAAASLTLIQALSIGAYAGLRAYKTMKKQKERKRETKVKAV